MAWRHYELHTIFYSFTACPSHVLFLAFIQLAPCAPFLLSPLFCLPNFFQTIEVLTFLRPIRFTRPTHLLLRHGSLMARSLLKLISQQPPKLLKRFTTARVVDADPLTRHYRVQSVSSCTVRIASSSCTLVRSGSVLFLESVCFGWS